MPELPEVERACKLVRDTCVGLFVTEMRIREQGGGPRDGLVDDLVFKAHKNPSATAASLVGRIVIGARRRGKYMWIELGARDDAQKSNETVRACLLLHFGMTGSLSVKGRERLTFEDFVVDAKWPPRFCKSELLLTSKERGEKSTECRLCFTDPRRLGRITLIEEPTPMKVEPVASLASDPIVDPLSLDAFTEGLRGRSAIVKSVLLDQRKLFCGLGNWVTDEVLYMAKIHPASRSSTLSDKQIRALHEAVLYVCQFAIKVNARSDDFPKSWLFHYRWRKNKRERQKLPNGHVVSFETIAGRTTALVAAEQHRGKRRQSGEGPVTNKKRKTSKYFKKNK